MSKSSKFPGIDGAGVGFDDELVENLVRQLLMQGATLAAAERDDPKLPEFPDAGITIRREESDIDDFKPTISPDVDRAGFAPKPDNIGPDTDRAGFGPDVDFKF